MNKTAISPAVPCSFGHPRPVRLHKVPGAPRDSEAVPEFRFGKAYTDRSKNPSTGPDANPKVPVCASLQPSALSLLAGTDGAEELGFG